MSSKINSTETETKNENTTTTTESESLSESSSSSLSPTKLLPFENQEPLVTVVSIPLGMGQKKHGTELGPDFMMKYGLKSVFNRLGYSLKNGNLQYESLHFDDVSNFEIEKIYKPGEVAINYEPLEHATESIYSTVYKHASQGRFVVNIGGDHCISIGTVSAIHHAYPKVKIIWIDAHADINSPATSLSKSMHGMPVNFAFGLNDHLYPWLKNIPVGHPSTKSLVYIGLRDIDILEKVLLKQHRILSFSMTEVDELGIAEVMKRTMKYLDPDSDCPIFISLDVDGLDPFYTPATGTPVKGGLSFRESRYICEVAAATKRLVGIDIAEVNPHCALDASQEAIENTCDTALKMIQTALGYQLI